MTSRSETYIAVEAALLNSGGSPQHEIEEALYAVVRFAVGELDASEELMTAMLKAAFNRLEKEGDT